MNTRCTTCSTKREGNIQHLNTVGNGLSVPSCKTGAETLPALAAGWLRSQLKSFQTVSGVPQTNKQQSMHDEELRSVDLSLICPGLFLSVFAYLDGQHQSAVGQVASLEYQQCQVLEHSNAVDPCPYHLTCASRSVLPTGFAVSPLLLYHRPLHQPTVQAAECRSFAAAVRESWHGQ